MRNQLGHPAGTFLSDFALPDLSGQIVRVSDLVGGSYLLVFVSPTCDPSAEVLQYLGGLSAAGVDIPRIIVPCSDGMAAARTIAGQHRLRVQVVVQEEQELLQFMRVPATPAAYHVSEFRTTVGPLAIGADAVISLLPAIMTPVDPDPSAKPNATRATPVTFWTNPGRHGLPVGDVAPEIEMATIGSDRASLSTNLGRWTLLIFWSPACPACDDVAGALTTVAKTCPGLAVMVVSRGNEQQHFELALLLGADVPVVLQEHRLAARQYQVFETPAGYLIDPAGRIAAPLAAGRKAVLRLIQEAAARVETAGADVTISAASP